MRWFDQTQAKWESVLTTAHRSARINYLRALSLTSKTRECTYLPCKPTRSILPKLSLTTMTLSVITFQRQEPWNSTGSERKTVSSRTSLCSWRIRGKVLTAELRRWEWPHSRQLASPKQILLLLLNQKLIEESQTWDADFTIWWARSVVLWANMKAKSGQSLFWKTSSMISMKSYSSSVQVASRASEPISTHHQASFNSVCHTITEHL